MKLKILLSSLILLLTFNLSAQIYSYDCILKKEVRDNIPDYTYGKYNFLLNLNDNTLKLDFIGEDIEYVILDYYKLCNGESIYFEVKGKDNPKNKLIISFNNEDKYIVMYYKTYEVFFFVKNIYFKE